MLVDVVTDGLVPAGTNQRSAEGLQRSELTESGVILTGDSDGFDEAGSGVLAAIPKVRANGVIRIAFASRYFGESHSVGAMAIRVIELLSRYNRDANGVRTDEKNKLSFHVSVYFIAGIKLKNDNYQGRVIEAADKIVFLPADLNTCVTVMRRANLDVLIYPEIGTDPVTYFLAYTRLATKQVAWLGMWNVHANICLCLY